MLNELSTTIHGRLLSAGILIALVGGGVASTYHDATGVALMSASLILGLGLAFVAVALAVETDLRFAIRGVIALPFLFFLFVVGLAVAQHDHATWAAYAFTAIGLLFGVNALRGTLVLGPIFPRRPAHAH